MKNRSEIREEVLKVLFQTSLYKKENLEYDIEVLINNHFEIENEFANNLIYGVITHHEELDDIANSYLKNWTINRLDNSGATILRMGIYEIVHTDTPNLVVINECLELAKVYSDDKVKNMINAVLDKVISNEH